MYLCTTPLPRFHTCNKKVFRPNEYHVTRLARHSVLILMLDGVLRFNEDGNDLELRAGEYYIQREGLQQTGRVLGELPRYYYLEFYGSYTDAPSDGLPLRGRWNRDAILPLAEQCVEALFSEQAPPFTLEATSCGFWRHCRQLRRHRTAARRWSAVWTEGLPPKARRPLPPVRQKAPTWGNPARNWRCSSRNEAPDRSGAPRCCWFGNGSVPGTVCSRSG